MVPASSPTNGCWPSLVSSIFQEFSDVLTTATVVSVVIIFYLDFCSRILAFLLLGFLCSSQCFSDCPSKSDSLLLVYGRVECIMWKNPPDDADEHPWLKNILLKYKCNHLAVIKILKMLFLPLKKNVRFLCWHVIFYNMAPVWLITPVPSTAMQDYLKV